MYTQNLITRFFGMNWIGPDPFGGPLVVVGEEAEENPFRFSTKYTDQETGLVYYGYRYYSPQVGRWLNRDPIGTRGGADAFAFVENSPSTTVDPTGLRKDNRYEPPVPACTRANDGGNWRGTMWKWLRKDRAWAPSTDNPNKSMLNVVLFSLEAVAPTLPFSSNDISALTAKSWYWKWERDVWEGMEIEAECRCSCAMGPVFVYGCEGDPFCRAYSSHWVCSWNKLREESRGEKEDNWIFTDKTWLPGGEVD